jgi:tRNA A37 threonylcarbamoyladenosine modification protein TsaB
MHDVVIIALSSPLLIGIYKDSTLIETIESSEHTSEALPLIFEDILQRYEIKNIIYANGPGSFMAIKVAYIFLKTLSIINNYTFLATDAFFFNENSPIKAIGKLCFVKTSQSIETQLFESVPQNSFALPKQINIDDFNHDTLPLYGIAAVG